LSHSRPSEQSYCTMLSSVCQGRALSFINQISFFCIFFDELFGIVPNQFRARFGALLPPDDL